jgi:hypothetical protein
LLLPAPDPSAYMTNAVIAMDDGNLLSAPRPGTHDRNTKARQAEIDRSIRIHD